MLVLVWRSSERRLSAGFEKLSGEIGDLVQRITDTELRLATEVTSPGPATATPEALPVVSP
jgi:hypothetical protein